MWNASQTVIPFVQYDKTTGENRQVGENQDPNVNYTKTNTGGYQVRTGTRQHPIRPILTQGVMEYYKNNPIYGDRRYDCCEYLTGFCNNGSNSNNRIMEFTYNDGQIAYQRKFHLVVAGKGGRGGPSKDMRRIKASETPNVLPIFLPPTIGYGIVNPIVYGAYSTVLNGAINSFNKYVFDPKLGKICFGGGGGGAGEVKTYMLNYIYPGRTMRVRVEYYRVYYDDYIANVLPTPWKTSPPINPSEFQGKTQEEINYIRKQTYTRVEVFWDNTLTFDDGVMDGKDAGQGELSIYAGQGGGGGEGGISNLTNKGEEGHYPGGGGSGGGVSSKHPISYDTDGGKARGTIVTFYDAYYKSSKNIISQAAYNYECFYGGRGDNGGATYSWDGVATSFSTGSKGGGRDGASGMCMIYYNIYPTLNGTLAG